VHTLYQKMFKPSNLDFDAISLKWLPSYPGSSSTLKLAEFIYQGAGLMLAITGIVAYPISEPNDKITNWSMAFKPDTDGLEIAKMETLLEPMSDWSLALLNELELDEPVDYSLFRGVNNNVIKLKLKKNKGNNWNFTFDGVEDPTQLKQNDRVSVTVKPMFWFSNETINGNQVKKYGLSWQLNHIHGEHEKPVQKKDPRKK
jgi:hypothetical protein